MSILDAKQSYADLSESRRFGDPMQSARAIIFAGQPRGEVLEGTRLRITVTPNADTPIATTQIPLLTIDVSEHAHYLDYQNHRLDCIAALLTHLIDWEFANENLQRALMPRRNFRSSEGS